MNPKDRKLKAELVREGKLKKAGEHLVTIYELPVVNEFNQDGELGTDEYGNLYCIVDLKVRGKLV